MKRIQSYLYLHLPNLPALLSQNKFPSARKRPLVIVSETGDRGVVRSVSPEAEVLGVREGLRVRDLRRYNGSLDIIPERSSERLSIIRELTTLLKSFTPSVRVKGEDRFLLDLTGTERLWGDPEKVAREILERLKFQWKLSASIGIGPTRTSAQIAASVVDSGNFKKIPSEKMEEFLNPLPVRLLPGVGPKTETQLKRYGLHTIGDLAGVSQELLIETFGAYRGILLWRMARGQDIGTLQVKKEIQSLQREMVLPEDTLDSTGMQAYVSYLCGRLALDLRKRKVLARRITLQVSYSDGLSRQINGSLQAGTNLEVELVRVARGLLDELLTLRRIRISHLGISVSRLRPMSSQRELFDLRGLTRQESVADEVFQVRNRYGFESLLPAQACAVAR